MDNLMLSCKSVKSLVIETADDTIRIKRIGHDTDQWAVTFDFDGVTEIYNSAEVNALFSEE